VKIRKIGSRRGWLLLLLAVAVAGAQSRRAAAQTSSPAGGDVTLAVVAEDGVTPVSTDPSAPLVLSVERHVVKAGDTVAQLLKANGIVPDAEAFGLVYDLNPSLKSAKEVATGLELLLPTVRAGEMPLKAGRLVVLTVDASLKEELLAKLDALDKTIASVSGLGVERFHSEEERRATLASLKEIGKSFGVVEDVVTGRVRPVSREVLGQLSAEAELLQATLARFAQPNHKPAAEDLSAVRLVEADLKVKRQTLTDVRDANEPPSRWREVLVVVRIVSQDGGPVSNLRVYYVPEALKGREQFVRSFDTLGSPSQRSLPEANYLIWAGAPGQDALDAAASEVKRLALRKTSDDPLSLDLMVIH
jgi:hypothetical protein